MKKISMAVVMVCMAVTGFGTASAEMVDIGLGQMEQSEFMQLKAMVNGQPLNHAPVVSTSLERPERYGPVEMSRSDYEALRDKVAGHAETNDERPKMSPAVQMADIGTGEMPMDEFLELKRMVSRKRILIFDHLAALIP